MKRRLLTPGWVLLHLVFVAAAITTLWLGWWQWERAHEAGGGFRNLGYALQWPLFGAFTLFLWYQVARMDLHKPQEEPSEAVASAGGAEQTGASTAGAAATDASAPHVPARVRNRPLVPPPAPPVDEDEDPELAAYNRYLRELGEADQHRR